MQTIIPPQKYVDQFEYIETVELSNSNIAWKFLDHNLDKLYFELINISKLEFQNWRNAHITEQSQKWKQIAKKINNIQKTEGFGDVNIGLLDRDALIEQTNNYIYSVGHYRIWRAILNHIIYTGSSIEYRSERVKYWIKEISPLSMGAYGITLKSGVLNSNTIFVLKYSIGTDDLEHEAAIGYHLNKLRENNLTLNFVYTYGIFNCTSPIIINDINKNFIPTWCHLGPNNKITNYIVIENIPEGITLSSALSKSILNLNQFLSILLQVVLAVYVAYREILFTHWDLHASNILLRKVPTEKILTYQFTGVSEKYYIATHGYIATIIDYGMSSAKIEENIMASNVHKNVLAITEYGKHGFINFYVDIYRFIIELYINLIPTPSPTFNNFVFEILNLMFPSSDIVDKIKSRGVQFGQGNNRHTIDNSIIYANIAPDVADPSINNFIKLFITILGKYNVKYIKNVYIEEKDINKNNDKILACTSTSSYCPTISEIIKKTSKQINQIPVTIIDYYNSNIKIDKTSPKNEQINNTFRDEVSNLLQQVKTFLEEIYKLDMLSWTVGQTLDESQFKILDTNLYNILQLKLLIEELELLFRMRYEIGGYLDIADNLLKYIINNPTWNNVLYVLKKGAEVGKNLLNYKSKSLVGNIYPKYINEFIYIIEKPFLITK